MSAAISDRRRPRIMRREAAKILQTSYGNVRRLERTKQLATGKPDREGTVTYDRREVETLANKRGLRVKPSGELAARVFRMFKERRAFQDIVIDTEQEPETIRALRLEYEAGFDFERRRREETEEESIRREHDDEMQAMDRELERRRRGVLFEGSESNGVAGTRGR